MGRVKIRLIGDRDSVYMVAGLFASRLKWKEYALYKDKEQTQIDESKTALYATMKTKLSEKTKSITLDQYISKPGSSSDPQTDIMPSNAAANPEQLIETLTQLILRRQAKPAIHSQGGSPCAVEVLEGFCVLD